MPTPPFRALALEARKRYKGGMALTSTIYTVDVTLADCDRNVYETLKCVLARHPSETKEFLATRLLAYCLEYQEGLKFSRGLSEPDEPAIWLKDYDGRIKSWIEVGIPDAGRLHKAVKVAQRVAVYAHKAPIALLKQLESMEIHKGETIPIYCFDPQCIAELGETLDRRTSVSLSVSGQQVYLEIGNASFSSPIQVRQAI